MRSILRFSAALAVVYLAAPVFAQTPLPRIIRGEIVSVDGANLAVRTRSGESSASTSRTARNDRGNSGRAGRCQSPAFMSASPPCRPATAR